MNRRRGFALLAVLWIITGAAVVAMSVSLAARERVRSAVNRVTLQRAEWQAEDCLARALVAIDALLGDRRGVERAATPAPDDSVAHLLLGVPIVRDCPGVVRLMPSGTRIDIGASPPEMLRRFMSASGIPRSRADSLVDALLDWRDADDHPRPRGCERGCYRALARPAPRNGPLADVAELAQVRGFESWDSTVGARPGRRLEDLFTTEPGRVALTAAPFEVLAALPGIGATGARDLIAFRRRPDLVLGDLTSVAGALSPIARDSFALGFDALARLATVTPDAWLLEVIAPPSVDGTTPPLGVRLVARLQLSGGGVLLQRRRFVP